MCASLVPGKSSGSVRDAVVKLLVKEHPLKLAEIHRAVRKESGLEVSLQGVKKAVVSLVGEGVLEKDSSKAYEISKKWIFSSKAFFDSLSRFYGSRSNSRVFNSLFSGGDYGEYHLKSLFELDNFWGDLLIYFGDNLSNEDTKEFAMYNNLGWWYLINYGSETATGTS